MPLYHAWTAVLCFCKSNILFAIVLFILLIKRQSRSDNKSLICSNLKGIICNFVPSCDAGNVLLHEFPQLFQFICWTKERTFWYHWYIHKIVLFNLLLHLNFFFLFYFKVANIGQIWTFVINLTWSNIFHWNSLLKLLYLDS